MEYVSFLDDDSCTDLGKMLDMSSDPGSSSGCTAVVTVLRDRQLFVANAGDSRCVVCRGGRAIEMSFG
jgi:protein phosphatase 1G